MASITGIVITKNEEAHISDCLESLKPLCQQLIVVDSGSQDATIHLAKRAGAEVYVQPYLGDGPQKNYGLQYAKNDWVLSLDADERLTPEAVTALKAMDLKPDGIEAYALRRRNYIGSRWIKRCDWYPDYSVRLYNMKKTRFSEDLGHAKVRAKAIKKLECDIIHWSYKNCGELFSKADRFSSRGAKMLLKKGKKAYFWSPFFHGWAAFFRKYIFGLGLLGGVDGMTVSLSAGVNSYLKYAKLLEYQRDPSLREKLKDGSIW
jgi:glycosyltransferase involved in cell wall biosynthesis